MLGFHTLAEGKAGHLNEIAARWRDAKVQDRTTVGGNRLVSMNLKDAAGVPVRVTFPDVPGEAFRRMWENRECEKEIEEILHGGNVLFLVHADDIKSPKWVVDEVALSRDAGLEVPEGPVVPWHPSHAPTQVQLVDLLQLLRRPPLDTGCRRLAIMLSAWDKASGECLSPEAYLREKLPLLDQYLNCGADGWIWRIYGASAQGGDYDLIDPDAERMPRAEELRNLDSPSKRIRLVEGEAETHDLTGAARMADGVKHSEWMTIQQTLHGYSDGHRQIAASATLKPSNLNTMLVLSDVSGPGARIEESGYLTGYPLTESGAYALARTWAATEMPRPGCVWTHTILIDFADLAMLASLGGLVSLFRRPQRADFGDYGKPLTFSPRSNAVVLTGADKAWSRQVLAGLYGEPSSPIVAARPVGVDIDQVILALWSQQWPRLRRAFRFCTLAATDRSSEGARFDLQLLPSTMDRSVRRHFSDAIDAETSRAHGDSWFVEAGIDLALPDGSGLRTFLRRCGGDGAMGRWAFRPLCRLHRMVEEFGSRRVAVGEAIALLQGELGSMQIREARGIVASAALRQGGELNDASLDFLLRHLELVDTDELAKAAERVGRAIWRREPGRLIPLLEGRDTFRVVPQRTFGALSLSDLAKGLRRAPALAQTALRYRPALVTEPAFWTKDLTIEDDAFAVLARNDEFLAAAVAALVAAQRDDLATRVVDQCGPSAVLDVVGSALEHDPERRGLEYWVSTASSDSVAVAQYLTTGAAKPRALLVALARTLPPDVVPNESGADPWLIAVQGTIGPVSERSAVHLSAYLLSRALDPGSRSAAALAQLGFESTHMAAASDRLHDEAWQLLEPRLPLSIFRRQWDKCRRIRAGVVGLFVNRDLAPQVFARIASEDKLFIDLAAAAAGNGRGKRYLKRVRLAMKNESPSKFAVRIRWIEKLVR